MLLIIKFYLTHIMFKKYKEKEIYTKINFALIINNNKLLRELNNTKSSLFYNNNKYEIINKNKNLPNIKEKFMLKPNFIIPPPISTGIIKNGKLIKKERKFKLWC